MNWRIAEKKLLFFRKIMLRDESNITRRALMNKMFMGLKWLSYECRQLTEMVGLPDIMANTESKGEIKQAIARYSNPEMKAEIQTSIKTCVGCEVKRRGLDMSGWGGLVIFWRRMSAKINATAAWWHVGLMPRVMCDISLLYPDNWIDEHK